MARRFPSPRPMHSSGRGGSRGAPSLQCCASVMSHHETAGSSRACRNRFAHMRESKVQRWGFEHYERVVDGAPKRSFSFRWSAMQLYADQHINGGTRHEVDSALIGRLAALATSGGQVKKRACKVGQGRHMQEKAKGATSVAGCPPLICLSLTHLGAVGPGTRPRKTRSAAHLRHQGAQR